MSGDDLTSALHAAPPLPPRTDLSPAALIDVGERLVARTWSTGLPSWFWGEGVCLLGIVRFAQARHRPVPAAVVDWLRHHHNSGISVSHVNNLAPGTAALIAATDYPDLVATADLLDQWFAQSPSITRAPNGALEHWPDGVWADTTFMAGVFLGHLGEHRRDPRLVAAFGEQLLAHAAILQHPDTGLFAHGSHRGQTLWNFWGRGNAWCALSAVEYLELAARGRVPVDHEQLDRITDLLLRQLTTLAALQPDHGVWSVLVDNQPENAGILEPSAAAGISAAMLRTALLLPHCPPEIPRAGWRAVAGALAYVDPTGTLTRVSAGTVLQLIPFGYSVIRNDRGQPWGQGLALHAIAAALRAHESGVSAALPRGSRTGSAWE
ncbi:glycoside hydrolase family 88 protein [Nocardia altamirensis]|uniref:glycoside hydrolase family 88 protein n=1 Tax=Nocardia altamirensis TaxID=472158 RepID=UPI0008409383|nr:glycoside hydrolase family 88 protein [Nocardia altamirensis]